MAAPEPDRLENLETRAAHADLAVAELNEVVSAQWKRIDALERELARLREEFEALGDRREGPEPPPPHY
jgi:SlyX protein